MNTCRQGNVFSDGGESASTLPTPTYNRQLLPTLTPSVQTLNGTENLLNTVAPLTYSGFIVVGGSFLNQTYFEMNK